MDVMGLRRRILQTTGGGLPDGYVPVEYLETHGYRARIDTGIGGNDQTIRMDFDVKSIARGNYVTAVGNYTNTEADNGWRFMQRQSGSSYDKQYAVNCGNRKFSDAKATTLSATIVDMLVNVQMEYAKCIVTEPSGKKNTLNLADSLGNTNNTHICVGGNKVDYDTGAAHYFQFYNHFRMWQGGRLVRDYRPCKRVSDDKPGFYDLVNQQFCPSIGTVDFTAGPEV